jgi:hypothetical protein
MLRVRNDKLQQLPYFHIENEPTDQDDVVHPLPNKLYRLCWLYLEAETGSSLGGGFLIRFR